MVVIIIGCQRSALQVHKKSEASLKHLLTMAILVGMSYFVCLIRRTLKKRAKWSRQKKSDIWHALHKLPFWSDLLYLVFASVYFFWENVVCVCEMLLNDGHFAAFYVKRVFSFRCHVDIVQVDLSHWRERADI